MADMPKALTDLTYQPRVQEFLADAVQTGRISHAYLFVGPPGSGKTRAALAFAKCLLCPNGGDARCDECIRVAHKTHPDVHILYPASAQGYLIAQIRQLCDDVSLAPIRAQSKIYIINSAGLLRGASANALLKTVEEPPAGVIFILLARSVDQVLPTLVSRAQILPFTLLSPQKSMELVERATEASQEQIRIALALTHSADAAVQYIYSAERQQLRNIVMQTIAELPLDDSWDVIVAAQNIAKAAHLPLDRLVETQQEVYKKNSEYLNAKALKQLETDNKRRLNKRERELFLEVIAAAASFLRDVFILKENISEPLVNVDFCNAIENIARHTSSVALVNALTALEQTRDDLNHNVSLKLVLELMLFHIKEALTCQSLSR